MEAIQRLIQAVLEGDKDAAGPLRDAVNEHFPGLIGAILAAYAMEPQLLPITVPPLPPLQPFRPQRPWVAPMTPPRVTWTTTTTSNSQ